ncbi:MAG TPA: hypothetical protein VJZ00_04775, partial [Thermoanaerobaculia bacterium]|nr:hypothetical protein [Thermoanaerobaculia bacterium]
RPSAAAGRGGRRYTEAQASHCACGMTAFEDRIRRMAREAMGELGRDESEIADVIEPPGADYCVITFTNPEIKAIEIPKPLGAGESQEQDEIRRALQYRFGS